MPRSVAIAMLAAAVLTSACARNSRQPERPARRRRSRRGSDWPRYYGEEFHGKITASGRPFDMNALVAAHPSYPFGTLLRVTNLANGRSVQVRILDRGPTRRIQAEGVIVDLSRRAAERLGYIRQGRTRVRLEVLEWADR